MNQRRREEKKDTDHYQDTVPPSASRPRSQYVDKNYSLMKVVSVSPIYYERGEGDYVDSERVAFVKYMERWERETAHLSSPNMIAMHESYQRIIGMGVKALPYIFAEMRRKPNHWFWALRMITGADPVHPENRGFIARMTQDWLDWAKEHNYI
ncbi:MAG: hypothetical protein HY804_00065 [Nitrospinae bacterium]|nr:hypothetical protein [Nitrospinota bacterium]